MQRASGKLIGSLAKNLKRLRGAKSQTEFAQALGISQASLNRLEQGTQNVTLTTIEKLCSRLRCKAGDLLDSHH